MGRGEGRGKKGGKGEEKKREEGTEMRKGGGKGRKGRGENAKKKSLFSFFNSLFLSLLGLLKHIEEAKPKYDIIMLQELFLLQLGPLCLSNEVEVIFLSICVCIKTEGEINEIIIMIINQNNFILLQQLIDFSLFLF